MPNAYVMEHPTESKYRFVNLEHYNDLKDKETRLRIRRLAMAEVNKARRKPKTRRERNEIVLGVRDSLEAQICLERLGSGQIDPFCRYPVEVNASDQALVANRECAHFQNETSHVEVHIVFDPNTNHFIRMRDYWYPVSLSCAAVFHNLLSISQNFILRRLDMSLLSQDDTLALTHSYKAIRAANEMMKDSLQYKSDEMIGTVASFMCDHVSSSLR
jgi:hypothetical protein